MARIIPAFMQFFDDNGDPLVKGWLRFTVSGTNNTDKDTFADNAETIANTNPVQLDGAGRCPNVFGTGSYNVRSYTDNAGSPGVQIQQFDPVGGTDAGGQFSEWLSSVIYGVGDIVIGSDDKYYRSLVASNQNNDPTVSPQQWEEVSLVGTYNQYITYAAGEIVLDTDGYLYRSLAGSNLNNTPSSNPTWWGPAILQTNLLADTITHNMASDADYTLTTTENRNGRIVITDTGVVLTTGRNIVVSTTERSFYVLNSTAQTLTFKTAAGTGIAIGAGYSTVIACDGTNVIWPNGIEDLAAGTNNAPKIKYPALDSTVRSWNLVETLSGSSGTSFQTTDSILSGYTECRLVIYASQNTTAETFQIRGKSGASVISAANYDSYGMDFAAAATTVLSQTEFDPRLNITGRATAAGTYMTTDVVFSSLGDGATFYPTATFPFYVGNNTVDAAGDVTFGRMVYQALTAFDGFYFFWDTGSAFTDFYCEVWAR